MASIQCPACGLKNPATSVRCDCGAPLDAAAALSSSAPVPVPGRRAPRTFVAGALGIIGGLVLLLGLGLDRWFVSKDGDTRVGAFSSERCEEPGAFSSKPTCETVPHAALDRDRSFAKAGRYTVYLGVVAVLAAFALVSAREIGGRDAVEWLRAGAGLAAAVAAGVGAWFVIERPARASLELDLGAWVYFAGCAAVLVAALAMDDPPARTPRR